MNNERTLVYREANEEFWHYIEGKEDPSHRTNRFSAFRNGGNRRVWQYAVLDGMVMTSEKDEFVYHEMVAHVPLFTHPNPENVLVVGGGDGGVIREILKHPSVKKRHLLILMARSLNTRKVPSFNCWETRRSSCRGESRRRLYAHCGSRQRI